ncbi:hypothetical protein AB834_07560 [PVC group bacterium (ex Bugula neritina AB1)]|nr:hypothetical protein AB834_07560 [PVC group bacterium (ex Bugula neritina AB1)]
MNIDFKKKADKKPKVSVMMASYKHPLWIEEAIESVLNQTFKDLELIIVDDASNDGSSEIIKKYAKSDDRIKYKVFQKNKGAVAATHECYKMSSSSYLSLISSDDIWELDKLQQQVLMLDSNKELGAVFALPTFIDSNSLPIKTLKNEFSNSLKPNTRAEWMNFFFNKGNCICHPTILIRKSCYEKVGFYNPALRSLPDFDMWVRLFFTYNVKVLDKKLIRFRKHDFNESRGTQANIIRNKTESKQILNQFIIQIKNIKSLIEIFPEHLDLFKLKDDTLIPFYIAQIALMKRDAFASDFAFDILYTEMAKPSVHKIIEENNLYSSVQLSQDVVLADIYKEGEWSKNTIYFKVPFLIKIEKKKKSSQSTFLISILNIVILKRIKTLSSNLIIFFGIKIR